MTDIDKIKKKRLQELIAKNQNLGSNIQEEQMKEELNKLMFNILDAKARERLNNIRVSKPDFALQVELTLLQLAQSGQVRIPINEVEFKMILNQLIPKKDFKIIRK